MSLVDDLYLSLIQSQLPPPPPRISARTRALNQRRDADSGVLPPELPKQHKAMHSLDELSFFAMIDSMPVMQVTKRARARSTMAARPRLSATLNPTAASAATRAAPKKPRKSSPTKRKSKTSAASSLTRDSLGYQQIINQITTADLEMKEKALEISELPEILESEPVLPIHIAIRVVLEATLRLGRPYDTNMLAMTFGVTRSLVMQSLRKHFEHLVEQSQFTENHFVPTYLWIYGLAEDQEAHDKIVASIKETGAGEPGCRSVFAIARDFVILHINEEGKNVCEIKHPPEVPFCFFEMSNSFQYRARMTGRQLSSQKSQG